MKTWGMFYLAALVVMVIFVILFSDVDRLNFSPVSAESARDLLMPLFVIALFLERAQEVFVKAWRKPEREVREQEIEAAEKAKKEARPSAEKAQERLDKANKELTEYRAGTGRRAFLVGLFGGILISLVGVRALYPLTDAAFLDSGFQKGAFNTVDILLTGGLLGGGSEGIHHVLALITEALKTTRNQLKKGASNSGNSQ